MNRRRARRSDEAAVTDVLGSLLLVGITVVAAVGLGLLVLSYDGPPDTQHSRLVASIEAGGGSWGDGDEELRLVHLGGEPLDASDVRVLLTPPGGPTQVITGAALGSAFADGKLTIGETWVYLVDAQLNDLYDFKVIVDTDGSQLVSDMTIVAGAGGGGSLCVGDTTAPVASFGQTPSNVNGQTSGAVLVNITVSDNCAGVDEAVAPHLFYCVAVTCVVPTSYTDVGAMTDTGTRTWSATIPSHNWLTQSAAGASLRYYVTAMTDANGNVGQSGVQTDLVDLVLTYTYVASSTITTGSIDDLGRAQAGSANDGIEADVAEGAAAGSPLTVGPTKYNGLASTIANSGAANPSNVATDNGAVAVLDTTGEWVEISGFDLPADANAVTSVTLGYNGQRSGGGAPNPTARLDYKIGAGSYVLGTSFPEDSGSEMDRTQSTSGITTVASVESMAVRVFAVAVTTRTIQVDHIFLTVTYTTAPSTIYKMDVRLDWTGVPSASSQTLELRYRVSSDTFNVEVWRFSGANAGTYRPCGGTLSSTSLTTFSCSLVVADEVSSGAVRIRLSDLAPTGTTQGHAFLDHARVASA